YGPGGIVHDVIGGEKLVDDAHILLVHDFINYTLDDGLGLITRLDRIRVLSAYSTSWWSLGSDERTLVEAVQTGNRISRRPTSFEAEIRHLSTTLKELPQALLRQKRTAQQSKKTYAQKGCQILSSTLRWWSERKS
ncbi:MAG: hypothetical protein ACYTGS_08025, partial [Planctomycetota bacterium]